MLRWHSIASCPCALAAPRRSCTPPTFTCACTSLPSPRPYRQVCRFSSADVQPFASQLLNVLLAKIGIQSSPERTAENDFLMRCARTFFFIPYTLCLTELFPGVARVIITAKQALVGEYVTVLQTLVNILRNVAQNPSNPNFDQYIFESISGLILQVPVSLLSAPRF